MRTRGCAEQKLPAGVRSEDNFCGESAKRAIPPSPPSRDSPKNMRKLVSKLQSHHSHFLSLNALHIFNDGFQASLLLLLPFIAATQHLSLTEVGILGTVVNVSGIILALPAGYLAVKFGGLKTLVAALFVYALAFAGVGILHNYYALFGMFLLAGIGFGLFHPIAFGLIAKWTPKERRGRTIGNFTAIGDVGRIAITAALSFIVVLIGWENTALLYAGAAILLGAGVRMFLRGREAPQNKTAPPIDMSLWQILRNRRLVFALAAAALDSFASASLYVFLPFLLLLRGIDPALLGSFTAAFFFGNLFGKTLLGRLTDKIGSINVFLASDLLMAIFIMLLATVTQVWAIIGCAIILGVFAKGTVPVLQAMMSDAVEHHGNYEKTFGIAGAITNTAIAVAPILLGAISDHFSIVVAFYIMGFAALLALIPGLGYYLTAHPRPTLTEKKS